MIKLTNKISRQSKLAEIKSSTPEITMQKPLKTTYGTELFTYGSTAFEKELLPNGNYKITNLDSGDTFETSNPQSFIEYM